MPRYPQSFIEEVRERTDIVALVQRYVSLRKQGSSWVGLCPFHQEKTASFNVHPREGYFKCFGCGEAGDVIAFVMRLRGLEFYETLEELAAWSGIPLPKLSASDKEQDEEKQERSRSLSLLSEVKALYQKQLQSPQGEKARRYLQQRGVTTEAIERFGLGYALPGWSGLLDYFGGSQTAFNALEKVGLVIRKEEKRPEIISGKTAERTTKHLGYDRFRDRIMFPIEDTRSRCVGFGGRTLLPDGQPKYLNSPETQFYQKGRLLYLLNQTQTAMRKEGMAVVVEGYLDAIALVERRIEPIAATLGTALTSEHLDLLWQRVERILFCFDGDSAGKKAAWRALEMVLPRLRGDRQVEFVFLPAGQDPDDTVRAEGADKFRQRLQKTTRLGEFLMQQVSEGINLFYPEGRATVAYRLNDYLGRIQDQLLRELYAHEYAQQLGITADRLLSEKDKQHNFSAGVNRFEPSANKDIDKSLSQPLPIPRPLFSSQQPLADRKKPHAQGAQGGNKFSKTTPMRPGRPFPGLDREQMFLAFLLRYPQLVEEEEESLVKVELKQEMAAQLLQKVLQRESFPQAEPIPLVREQVWEYAAWLLQQVPDIGWSLEAARDEFRALMLMLQQKMHESALQGRLKNTPFDNDDDLANYVALRFDKDRLMKRRLEK